MIEHSRRRFLTGLGAILCAPAIVRVASLMPLSVPKSEIWTIKWGPIDPPLIVFNESTIETLNLEPGGLNYITATEIRTLEQQALKRYAKLFDRVLNPPIIANWPLGHLSVPSRN